VWRRQRQILSLLPLLQPARLLLWAAWACEWDSTSPLTAGLSLISRTACAYITATHLMHAHASSHPAQHTPPQYNYHNQDRESLRLNTAAPKYRYHYYESRTPIKLEMQSQKRHLLTFHAQQALPHAQRNLEARRPPRWSGRQLFWRGACCLDVVIGLSVMSCWGGVKEGKSEVSLSLFECLSCNSGRFWKIGPERACGCGCEMRTSLFYGWTFDDSAGWGWVIITSYWVGGMERGVSNGVSKHKRCRMLFEEQKLACVYLFFFLEVIWPCRIMVKSFLLQLSLADLVLVRR
jgi:hypothetical protein